MPESLFIFSVTFCDWSRIHYPKNTIGCTGVSFVRMNTQFLRALMIDINFYLFIHLHHLLKFVVEFKRN